MVERLINATYIHLDCIETKKIHLARLLELDQGL